MFRVGENVKMSKEALDNYGKEFVGIVLTVQSVANRYMPARQFFDLGMPNGYHPGYDEALAGMCLYDFEEINFPLYEWEIQKI